MATTKNYKIWKWIWAAIAVVGMVIGHNYGTVIAWVAGIMAVLYFLADKAEAYAAKAAAEGRAKMEVEWEPELERKEFLGKTTLSESLDVDYIGPE